MINHSSWILYIVQLADSLPSKTIPSNVRRQQSASAKAKGKRPAKKRKSQPASADAVSVDAEPASADASQVAQVIAHVQAKEKVTIRCSI